MKQEQCQFSKKLNAYIDTELTEIEFEKVQEHLKHCHLCQKELRELININTFLANYQEEEITDNIYQSILNKTTETNLNPERSQFKRRIISFSVAASVIVSFVTGVLLSDLTFTQETDSEFDFGQNSLYSYFEGE